MITLHSSNKFNVTSWSYSSCKDKNNDPKCICTLTCMGGLSLRGREVGSLHQKGQRITHIRNNHSPGKGMKAFSPWKLSWVHPSPKGTFPSQNCCSKENCIWILSEAPFITWLVWGSLLYTEAFLGRGLSLLTKGICTSYFLHCGGQAGVEREVIVYLPQPGPPGISQGGIGTLATGLEQIFK